MVKMDTLYRRENNMNRNRTKPAWFNVYEYPDKDYDCYFVGPACNSIKAADAWFRNRANESGDARLLYRIKLTPKVTS